MTESLNDPIWNVPLTVVDLIAAPTGQEAVDKPARPLEIAGFEVYDLQDRNDWFESESLPPSLEERIRLA